MPNVMTVYVRRVLIANFYVLREPFRAHHKAIRLNSQGPVEVCWTSNLLLEDYTLSFIGILCL